MYIAALYVSCDRARAVARSPDLATRATEGLHFPQSSTHSLGDSSWRQQETFGQAFRRGRRPAPSAVSVPAGSEARAERGQAFRRGQRPAPSAVSVPAESEARAERNGRLTPARS
jgi:hypothetical protein